MSEFVIIKRKDLKVAKWDALVKSNKRHDIFSLSFYMDILAENWDVLVKNDYSCGIALPYSVRMGVEKLYTPNFIRYIEWLGEEPEDWLEVRKLITNHFSVADICLKSEYFGYYSETRVYQRLDSVMQANKLCKRNLSKFEKSLLSVEKGLVSSVFKLVWEQLKTKAHKLRAIDGVRFNQLCTRLEEENMLDVFVVKEESTVKAAQLFAHFNKRYYYLKGGAKKNMKENGAMYAIMYQFLKQKDKDLPLDFVGSNATGVQQFNKCFGAKDHLYYNVHWNKGPVYYKLMLALLRRRK